MKPVKVRTHVKFYDAYGQTNGECFIYDEDGLILNVDVSRLMPQQRDILALTDPTHAQTKDALKSNVKRSAEDETFMHMMEEEYGVEFVDAEVEV